MDPNTSILAAIAIALAAAPLLGIALAGRIRGRAATGAALAIAVAGCVGSTYLFGDGAGRNREAMRQRAEACGAPQATRPTPDACAAAARPRS